MAPKELIGALVVEPAHARTLEVVETDGFAKDAREIFTEDEIAELHQHLGMSRQLGAVIKRYGWTAQGKVECGRQG